MWKMYTLYILAVYNLERITIYYRLNRPEVNLGRLNLYTYKLDKRKKTDYREGMVASIIFAVFAIMISVSYVGKFLTNPVYQVLRDGLTLIVANLIYLSGSFKINRAMGKF